MNILPAFWAVSLHWQDLIEILFFWITFYYISLWLHQDKQKKMLLYFYGYCLIAFTSYIAGLGTINAILFLFSPVIIIGFMLMHQTSLQKNMVSLKNITTGKQPHTDWLAQIMRLGVTMQHNNKELFLLIEHTDSIAKYVTSQYTIHAPATNDLLFMLVNHVYNPSQMIWIQTDGTIRGVNSQWKTNLEQNHLQDWISDAVAYTSKNDSLLLHINTQNDTYSLIYEGSIEHELTIDQAHQLIRKKIGYPLPVNQKGYYYDNAIKKTDTSHPLS